MTDEVSFSPNNFELFRWDKDGKLVYVHPTLIEVVNKLIDVRVAEEVTTLRVELANLRRQAGLG